MCTPWWPRGPPTPGDIIPETWVALLHHITIMGQSVHRVVECRNPPEGAVHTLQTAKHCCVVWVSHHGYIT